MNVASEGLLHHRLANGSNPVLSASFVIASGQSAEVRETLCRSPQFFWWFDS